MNDSDIYEITHLRAELRLSAKAYTEIAEDLDRLALNARANARSIDTQLKGILREAKIRRAREAGMLNDDDIIELDGVAARLLGLPPVPVRLPVDEWIDACEARFGNEPTSLCPSSVTR